MNKERLKEVAEAIQNNAAHFNMLEGLGDSNGNPAYESDKPEFVEVDGVLQMKGDCGTTCCIAGFAALMYYENPEQLDCWNNIHYVARTALDLDYREARELFETSVVDSSLHSGDELLPITERNYINVNGAQAYANLGAKRIYEFMLNNS